MNTIPSIFNEKITPYTAVGGKERNASSGLSAIILNRAGLPRRSLFQELEKTGFENVISIESSSPHYDIEELSGRFPFVRFILPENEINLGEQINLAASETESPLFFVLRSDIKIIAGGTAKRMAERLTVSHDETQGAVQGENEEKKFGFKRLCTVPLIMNPNYEILPTLVAPVTNRRKIKTVFMEPNADGNFSLYPYDGIGIYDRQRFIQTGGFDTTIKNQAWQLADFGFRAHLWGEEIAFNHQFKLLLDGDLLCEDLTIDENYRQFYMKNLAPVLKNDNACIPLPLFVPYLFNSQEDLFSAWKEFSKSRNWVEKNKFRWRFNPHEITSRWDSIISTGSANT